MKFILILIVTINFAWATNSRQYVQCSDPMGTSVVSVLNLPQQENGTFFISSGMENDESERLLCKIQLKEKKDGQIFYDFVENCQGELSFEEKFLGKVSDSMKVNITLNGLGFDFICFSRLYP